MTSFNHFLKQGLGVYQWSRYQAVVHARTLRLGWCWWGWALDLLARARARLCFVETAAGGGEVLPPSPPHSHPPPPLPKKHTPQVCSLSATNNVQQYNINKRATPCIETRPLFRNITGFETPGLPPSPHHQKSTNLVHTVILIPILRYTRPS